MTGTLAIEKNPHSVAAHSDPSRFGRLGSDRPAAEAGIKTRTYGLSATGCRRYIYSERVGDTVSYHGKSVLSYPYCVSTIGSGEDGHSNWTVAGTYKP